MSLTLKPYPEYKDSRLPWLGKVPLDWRLFKTKYLFTEKSTKGFPEEPLLAATQTRGVIPKSLYENRTVVAMKDLHLLKLVEKGDYVISLRSFQGGIEFAHYRGIISPAYTVLTPTAVARSDYFDFLFKSRTFIDSLSLYVTGIREGQNIDYERLSRSQLPVPSEDEQLAIGKFLRGISARINKLVRTKRRVVDLLSEQKRRIIQEIITATFVPHLSLNILGMPQTVTSVNGWNSLTVGRLLQLRWLEIQDGNHGELHPKAAEYVDEGIPFLMANDVRVGGLNFVTCNKITEEQARGLRIGFAKARDVLLTHKATIGEVGIVPDEIPWPFIMLTPQVTYYRSRTPKILQRYLYVYMQSVQFQEQLRSLSLNQSTRPYIGLLEQRNLVISYPSSEHQIGIIRDYENATSKLNQELRKIIRGIDLIREYHSRLTADVVTGMLDVRDVELQSLETMEGFGPLTNEVEAELEDEELTPVDEVEDATN